MISSILFDFGGTLDSDGGHWLDRTFLTYKQIGLGNIDKSLIKEAFYWADGQATGHPKILSAPYRDMMQLHFGWQFQKLGLKDPAKQADAVTFFVRAAERILRRNGKILETLSQAGLQMGVISNSYGNVETLCREFGYNSYFKVLIDSFVEGVHKPDPQIYTLALERLDQPAQKVLMVGDNFERDVLPAKALGMKTAWLVGHNKRPCPDASKVDLVFKSLDELPERLKALQAVTA
jgi:HAD superfamily hydrolase (TIGR01509 family)